MRLHHGQSLRPMLFRAPFPPLPAGRRETAPDADIEQRAAEQAVCFDLQIVLRQHFSQQFHRFLISVLTDSFPRAAD